MFQLGEDLFSLHSFASVLKGDRELVLSKDKETQLNETRTFIEYLLKSNISVYGLTTGFADMRDKPVDPKEAALLSENILLSHDAGIGDALSPNVTLGAMILRAHSLAKGYSGFQVESLKTLMAMIEAKIIPEVPCFGSLGASGDLAYLARLGRAMQGHDVPVLYKGEKTLAGHALRKENIPPFRPAAKEGLALTNGTNFMASMMAIAYLEEIAFLENLLGMLALFLNAIEAIDAAFFHSIHEVRHQTGQIWLAKILGDFLYPSPMKDGKGIQDDYSIRCLPQILGCKFEVILEQRERVERELNAATDNPLLFRNEAISSDVTKERILTIDGTQWTVPSGGNFHGEYLTTIADILCMANVKIVLTMERHMTYLMNPNRNKNKFPPYLITTQGKEGLQSGFMVTQYAGNALAQKIAHLGNPVSTYNLTSANECEDVVSYGATASLKLLEQLELLEQFSTIYLTIIMQAYSIRRKKFAQQLSPDLPSEKIFHSLSAHLSFPIEEETAFDQHYVALRSAIKSNAVRQYIPSIIDGAPEAVLEKANLN